MKRGGGVKRKTIRAIILFVALLLVACDSQFAHYPEAGNYSLGEGIEAYADIINAYRELEISGFTVLDESLIGHSFFAEYARFGTPPHCFGEPYITYALHDINEDGIPELFIGADGSITGIYALQDGKLISIIQQISFRYHLNLLTDIDGRYIIELSSERMSQAREAFFAVDENGELITLDRLYTKGHSWRHNEVYGYDYIYAFFRYRYISGEHVSITEEEYSALIRKYGAWGYSPEDTSAPRFANLEWNTIVQ